MARKSKRLKNTTKTIKTVKKRKNVRASLKTSVSKLVKNRLTRIHNLICKHINNERRHISPQAAQKYLKELESMKIHCLSNMHYLQVHEKLSKQMALIMRGDDQLCIFEEQEMQTEVQYEENKIDEVLSTNTAVEISQERCMAELRSTQTTPSDILNIDDIVDLTGDVTLLDPIDIVTHITSTKSQISYLRNVSKDFNENNSVENLTELNYDTPSTCINEKCNTFVCHDHNYYANASLLPSSDVAIATNCLGSTTTKESINAENLLNDMIDSNASTPEIHLYDSLYPKNENDVINHTHNSNNNPITSMILDIEESMVSEDHLKIDTPNKNSQYNMLFEKDTNSANYAITIEINDSEIKHKAPIENECAIQIEAKNRMVDLYNMCESQQNYNSNTPIIDNTDVNHNIETVNSITSLISNFEALETENNSLGLQKDSMDNSHLFIQNNVWQVPQTSNSSYKKDCNILKNEVAFYSTKIIHTNDTGPNCSNKKKHNTVMDEDIDNSKGGVINTLNITETENLLKSEFDWFKDIKFVRDINDTEYFSNAVLPEGFWSNESLPKEWEADFDVWD